MHAFLHLIASTLVLPYVALAAFFLLVGEAARAKGLFALLDVALYHTNWIFRWGIYVVPVLWLLLAASGFIAPVRRAGALTVCLLAVASLLVIVLLQSSRWEAGQLLFLAPCLAVAAMSAWLFIRAADAG